MKLKTEQNSGLNFFSGFDFITAWVVFITAKISVISSHPLVLLDKNLEGNVLTSIWQTAYTSWIKENWTSRYLLISVLVGGIWTESCSSISFVKKKNNIDESGKNNFAVVRDKLKQALKLNCGVLWFYIHLVHHETTVILTIHVFFPLTCKHCNLIGRASHCSFSMLEKR